MPYEPSSRGLGLLQASDFGTDGSREISSSGVLPVLPLDNLTDLVFELLRSAIMDKTIPPGTRVTEAGLAKQLNTSKTPVREALLRLRQIGLIEADGRRGGRVISPSRRTIEGAYEVREALESFTARSVAPRASEQQRVAIETAAVNSLRGAENDDFEQFSYWDAIFHNSITAAADNPRLSAILDDVISLIITLRKRDLPDKSASIECARGHIEVAAAIRTGDGAAAADAMRRHVQTVRWYVVLALADVLDNEATPRGELAI